jgi:clan AA aspartic protease
MITGVVESDEGRIRLIVKGPQGRVREIEAVVDTGYSELLTLPPELIVALDLRWRSVDRGTLADGSECLFDVYEAKVMWDGRVRRILVDEADADPLVGMKLLRGYELKMEVRTRGKVTIKRLPLK